MRIALSLLTLALLVFGGHALASGDDDAPGKSAPGKSAPGNDASAAAAPASATELTKLKLRLQALEMETTYLRAREAALTAYVLQNEHRALGLQALAAKARSEGYENKKIPAPSRITLMAGLDGYSKSLLTDLPTVTKEDAALLKKLTAFRRLKQLNGK